MAIPIKAIPTLYGEEAARMMKEIRNAEERFEHRPKRDKSNDSYYMAMRKFLEKSDMQQVR